LPPPADLDDAGSCARVGVSPSVVAATASLGAGLTLALLRGEGEAVAGLLTRLVDGGRAATVAVRRDPSCPTCGEREFRFLAEEVAGRVERCCGGGAFEVFPDAVMELDLAELEKRLAARHVVRRKEGLLFVGTADGSAVIFRDGRALIYGARDELEARSVYGRFFARD
jgi:adenylyltransferase/sulfurtransferase